MDIDEKSIIKNSGFEAKPDDWFHDLEYIKKGGECPASVYIDIEYTPDSTTVDKIT